MGPATQYLEIDSTFTFKCGGALPHLTLAYETWGTLNPDRSNAVVICTGLSPGAHAASCESDPTEGWWEFMIGPGKPIDTNRFFVICVNSLGSCLGSSGPSSLNPDTQKPWRLDFPELRLEDVAEATRRVVKHLGIDQLCALVGPSMGGMTTLAWLKHHGQDARHLASISSAPRGESFSIALRSLQREVIVSDPNWNHGRYTDEQWPEHGMRMARKLGMISYRSAIEWNERFGRDWQSRYEPRLFGMHFEIESYLQAAADRFIGTFDPCCYLYLSRAMDWFDVSENHDSMAAALANVKLESALVVGVETDLLFPIRQQKEIAQSMEALGIDHQLVILPSIQGHDAFLVDYERFESVIGEYFQTIATQEFNRP